MLDVHINLF